MSFFSLYNRVFLTCELFRVISCIFTMKAGTCQSEKFHLRATSRSWVSGRHFQIYQKIKHIYNIYIYTYISYIYISDYATIKLWDCLIEWKHREYNPSGVQNKKALSKIIRRHEKYLPILVRIVITFFLNFIYKLES